MKDYKQILLTLLAACTLASCGGGGGNHDNDNSMPDAPSLTMAVAANKTFEFSWKDVSGETGYRLLESADGSDNFTQIASLAADSVSHAIQVPLYKRVNAKYKLQACNASGCRDSDVTGVTSALNKAISYIKASNAEHEDSFGNTFALSADGTTLAIGAYGEDSDATGINGDQDNNSAGTAGAVYIFIRNGSAWSQQAYVKASNTGQNDIFGYSLALSADGNTLAVGAMHEDSHATGINGNQTDNSAIDSGAVYIFTRSANTWGQQAYIKASNTGQNDRFGTSMTLSADGDTLAVGAYGEGSKATGINGDQSDNTAEYSGAVYVFTRSSNIWSQQAYVKASNTEEYDYFGYLVALSSDGNTLAVGAPGENSNATGINGNQADNSADNSGAAYIFSRSGNTWSQQSYIKASNSGQSDFFGYSMALSSDGNTLAAGAYQEASNTTGINGDQADNSANYSGAVYVFTRSGSTWSQQAYIKASNTNEYDVFGVAIALSADGNTLAVGAYGEESGATGINGDQADNSVDHSGAVYVFTRSGSTWSQQAYIKASNTDQDDYFGSALALSADGNTLAVGAYGEDSNATGINGDQLNNSAVESGAVYVY